MKFSAALVAGFAAFGLAKPSITNLSFNLTEGQPFTLTWIDAVGPVKVELVTGADSQSLQPIRTLATGETDGSFTFTPSGLASGNYAFRVTDSDGLPNFSLLFPYTGTAVSSSATGSSSRTSTRSTTSAASSTPVSSDVSSITSASSTSTRTTSTRTTATTTPTNTPTNNNEGQRFSSSLALVFMTVAALVFFN
ncbi:hypothetical protein B0T16DRAFT_18282 [Cercophora newfieldiana]|uniref:Extracellular matrix protein n=1 Tax=Cercophora newfieldiana TaxID=92897 RepID=A0AA40CY21_9PEZI|nr:hypothetical protein B0T16DRAFT_18282 [Cercophora newfieldiana]